MAEENDLLNGYAETHCECGKKFSKIESVKDHIMQCSQFQSRFGELVKILKDVIENIRTKNDYDIIKFLFHILRHCIREKLKNTRFIPEFKPNPSSELLNPLERKKTFIPTKLELSKPLQPLPESNSFAHAPVTEQMFNDEAYLKSCQECSKIFPNEKSTLCLTCGHRICINCVKAKALSSYSSNGQIICKCGKPLTDTELQVTLNYYNRSHSVKKDFLSYKKST